MAQQRFCACGPLGLAPRHGSVAPCWLLASFDACPDCRKDLRACLEDVDEACGCLTIVTLLAAYLQAAKATKSTLAKASEFLTKLSYSVSQGDQALSKDRLAGLLHARVKVRTVESGPEKRPEPVLRKKYAELFWSGLDPEGHPRFCVSSLNAEGLEAVTFAEVLAQMAAAVAAPSGGGASAPPEQSQMALLRAELEAMRMENETLRTQLAARPGASSQVPAQLPVPRLVERAPVVLAGGAQLEPRLPSEPAGTDIQTVTQALLAAGAPAETVAAVLQTMLGRQPGPHDQSGLSGPAAVRHQNEWALLSTTYLDPMQIAANPANGMIRSSYAGKQVTPTTVQIPKLRGCQGGNWKSLVYPAPELDSINWAVFYARGLKVWSAQVEVANSTIAQYTGAADLALRPVYAPVPENFADEVMEALQVYTHESVLMAWCALVERVVAAACSGREQPPWSIFDRVASARFVAQADAPVPKPAPKAANPKAANPNEPCHKWNAGGCGEASCQLNPKRRHVCSKCGAPDHRAKDHPK